MVLRHKLVIRAAAVAGFALCVWWFVDERTWQAAVSLLVALLVLIASLRALLVVRDDALYRRGLTGWERAPLLLEELTAVALRREVRASYFRLVLRLSGRDGVEVTIECWAWTGWRGLAHRAGHFARRLGARRDDVTARRMACTRPDCPWDSHALAVVGGRRAGPPPDDDLSTLGLRQCVGVVAGTFAFGFAFGLFSGWSRSDLEMELVPYALACGGAYAVAGVAVVLWEKVKGNFILPPASSRPPHH